MISRSPSASVAASRSLRQTRRSRGGALSGWGRRVIGIAKPRENLARARLVPIAKARPQDGRLGRPASALEDAVAAVEIGARIAGIGEGLESRIGGEDRRGPLPHLAEHGKGRREIRGALPFRLARQAHADEAAIGLGLI